MNYLKQAKKSKIHCLTKIDTPQFHDFRELLERHTYRQFDISLQKIEIEYYSSSRGASIQGHIYIKFPEENFKQTLYFHYRPALTFYNIHLHCGLTYLNQVKLLHSPLARFKSIEGIALALQEWSKRMHFVTEYEFLLRDVMLSSEEAWDLIDRFSLTTKAHRIRTKLHLQQMWSSFDNEGSLQQLMILFSTTLKDSALQHQLPRLIKLNEFIKEFLSEQGIAATI